jgi:predicted phosphodiesterase
MPGEVIRVLSDLHYGDRSSRIASLDALTPLFDGVTGLVLNGDTLDTRAGPFPERTAARRQEVTSFFSRLGAPVTFLTGNHDPDISDAHWLDLAGDRIWAIHGDILFEDIVPWASDAPLIRRRMRAALEKEGRPAEALELEERLAVIRSVTRSIPQRGHHAEPKAGPYVARLFHDLLWPPWRLPRLLEAWRSVPARARRIAARYRPKVRFALLGHTHRPGIWTAPGGLTVINTGSFTLPFGCWAADLTPDRLSIRRIARRDGRFRAEDPVAEFPI